MHRLKWEVIKVLQIFLEHVLLKNPFEKSVAYLIRLRLVMDLCIIVSNNQFHLLVEIKDEEELLGGQYIRCCSVSS